MIYEFKKLIYLSVLVLFISPIAVYAQCDAPMITERSYCDGQLAQIKVEDPSTNVNYRWYNSITDQVGGYGVDGRGRHYFSSGIVSGSETYFYVKETDYVIGPDYRNNLGGAALLNDGVEDYSIDFNADLGFVLNRVTVIARLDDPTASYGFSVRYDNGTNESFSDWYINPRTSYTSLGGNFYRIDIPVTNIVVLPGNAQTLQVISLDNVADGYLGADAFYWWNAAAYNGSTYANGNITTINPTRLIGAVERTPLFMDWDITLQCERTPVTTELASNCCVPVQSGFTITAPTTSPSASDFPLNLTATGGDINATMYYFWYDADGVLINNGQGLNQISVTEAGQYTLRVVNDPADINANACYANRSILLGIRSLFAPDDQTICIGDVLELSAFGAEGGYEWSSLDPIAQDAIVTPSSQSTMVNLLTEGTFTFQVEAEVLLDNIASDGKFDRFDRDLNFDPLQVGRTFETSYGIAGGDGGLFITNNGQYRVDNVIRAWSANNDDFCDTNPDFWYKTDPVTGDVVERGNIFYADAHTSGPNPAYSEAHAMDRPLWQLSNQPVQPNTDYVFSMDVAEWNGSAPPEIMLLVNGVSLPLSVNGIPYTNPTPAKGNVYSPTPADVACRWVTVSGVWNSGANTTATITVSEVAKVSPGHEFAMDDITFSSGRGKQTDEVTITVNNCFEMEARPDGSVCLGEPFDLYLTRNNGFLTSWTLPNGTVVSTDENTEAYPLSNQTYTANVKFPIINYIKNGDFEGDTPIDFETDLLRPGGNDINQGDYFIGTGTSSLLHSSMRTNQPDHTLGTVLGKMFVMRFRQNDAIIRKTIPVVAGENYGFSAWFKHMHAGGANSRDYPFQILIDGVVQHEFILPSGQDWTQYNFNWLAPTTGNVTFVLRSPLNHFETGLAIDDISLARLGMDAADQVNVSVNVCNTLSVSDLDCDGEERSALATTDPDAVFMGWFDESDDLVTIDKTLTVTPLVATDYTAKIAVIVGNQITNGNFENGTTGFTSAQNVHQTNQPWMNQDNYMVFNTTVPFNEMANVTGDGNFLIVNPQGGANRQVYRTATNLIFSAGVDYAFEFDFAYLYQTINTVTVHPINIFIGTTLVATVQPNQTNDWQKILVQWTQASDQNAPLRIENVNSPSIQRYVLGFDNMKLGQLIQVGEETITLTPCCTPADIDVAPLDVEICQGEDAVFEVTASAPTGALTYQWQVSTNNGTTWTDVPLSAPYTGVTSDELTITSSPAALNGSRYRAIVYIDGSCEAQSESALLEVTPTPSQPTIAVSPNQASFCAGEAHTLTASSTTTGVTFIWSADASGTNNPQTGITTAGTHDYVVTASLNGCLSLASATTSIEVHTTPDLTVIPPSAVCEGAMVDITTTWTDAAATIDPTVTYHTATPTTVGNAITLAQAAAIATAGTYYVKVDNEGCIDEAEIEVTINALPTGVVSGDNTICDDGTSTAMITLTFTGTPNFDFTYTGDASADVPVTGHGSTIYTFTTTSDETYSLVSLTDGNGCAATSLTGSAEIDYYPTLTATRSLNCGTEAIGGVTLANDEFQIVIEITGGTASGVTGDNGVTFTETSLGSGIWYSGAISELLDIDVIATDANGCENVTFTALNQRCSCPATGTLDVTTGEPITICPGADTELTLTFGGGVGPYNLTLTGGTTPVVLSNQTTSPVTFDVEAGTYTATVESVGDNCMVSAQGSVTISNHTVPTATLSGTPSICDDGSSTGALTIELTGTGPWNVDYTDGTTPSTITIATSPHTLNEAIGSYSLISVADANCDGTVSGTGTITGVTPPVATITVPATSPYQTGNASQALEADDLGTGYSYAWTIESGQGALSAATGLVSTLSGLTATDPDPNSTTEIKLVVTDAGSICPSDEVTISIIRVSQTIADAGDDATICETSGLTRVGNGLIGSIETASWRTISGPSTFTSADPTLTIPANSAVGVYEFEYEVINTINGTTTDRFTLTIQASPSAADAGADISTCASSVNLAAVAPLVGTGAWSIENGQGTISDPTDRTSALTGLIAQGTTVLRWTVSNGVCTATTSDVTVTQVGDITTPTISINGTEITGTSFDMCVGTAYNIAGNVPTVTEETGAWTSGLTGAASQSYTPTATGSVTFTWQISTSVGGCTPATKTVTANISNVPQGGAVNAVTGCEGTSQSLAVTGITGDPATSYAWTTSTGTLSQASTTSANNSITLGTTNGTISVIPINGCGQGTAITNTITTSLKPSNAGGSIGGTIPSICGSDPNRTFTADGFTDASITDYKWVWTTSNGTITPPNGTSATITSGNYTGVTTGTIRVTPVNACGDGTALASNVSIITPQTLSVGINIQGQTDRRICIPEDEVFFVANPSNGLDAGNIYEFSSTLGIISTKTGDPVSDSRLPFELLDGELVTVTLTAPLGGCFIGGNTATASLTIDGYNSPSATYTIVDGFDEKCETDDKEILLVRNGNKGDLTYNWYRINEDQDTLFVGIQDTLRLNNPNQSGNYFAVTTHTVCSDVMTSANTIKIYEQPRLRVKEYLVIEIEEGAIDQMEVISTGLDKDTLSSILWRGEFIEDPSELEAYVIPTGRFEGTFEYMLTVTTGTNQAVCIDSVEVKILYKLPLNIPNAFTPNGDGINDTWFIQGMSAYPDAVMRVYNRWGNLVFEQFGGYPQPWKGTNRNGGELSIGTYYYILDLNDTERSVKTGDVTILR